MYLARLSTFLMLDNKAASMVCTFQMISNSLSQPSDFQRTFCSDFLSSDKSFFS